MLDTWFSENFYIHVLEWWGTDPVRVWMMAIVVALSLGSCYTEGRPNFIEMGLIIELTMQAQVAYPVLRNIQWYMYNVQLMSWKLEG